MARYSGDGSYEKLLADNYSKNATTGGLNNVTEADSGVKYIPFSFLRTGYYDLGNGGKNGRDRFGLYWESRAVYGTDAYYLSFRNEYISLHTNYNKGRGYSVRWGDKGFCDGENMV